MSAVAERPPAPSAPQQDVSWRSASSIGWAGVVLGFLALFVAVPPIEFRSVAPTVILGVLGVAAGAVAIRGGEKRVGGGAIVACVGGVAVGIAATKSGAGNLERVVAWSALLAA